MCSLSYRAVIAALALLALLLVAPHVTAQGSGAIEGQVVNGTQGGPAIDAGISVTLHVFQGGAEIDTQETTTGPGGAFRFEGLDTDLTLEYWIEATYQDVTYTAQEPYLFAEGETTLQAVANVFETTDADAAIRISSVHMIAESFGQALRVTEIHLLSNTGDRAFVGQPGEGGTRFTLSIPLPEGAVGISFDEGMAEDRFVQVEGGLLDTDPVAPGQSTSMVFFSYHLMVAGDRVQIDRAFDYPVDTLNVLVVQPGLGLESEQLEALGLQSIQGRQYDMYEIRGLPAGTALSMDLIPVAGAEAAPATSGGEPAAPASSGGPSDSTQEALRWIGFALSLAAVAAAFIYPSVARRRVPARAPATDLSANPRTRALLQDLASLEDARDAGTIVDDEYARERDRLYTALKSQPHGRGPRA
ncbi:MAG: hypothetical protein JXA93_12615 [Anaerolineae bacterium]|nr:hypothetical protein [Anaerolineae bacterium]